MESSMRARTLMLALTFATNAGLAAAQGRPVGPNCNLAAPPAGAGESFSHGLTLYVFPRARNLGPTYTGCQSMMARYGDKWKTLMVSEFVGGDPIRLWAPEGMDPETMKCRYERGQVVRGNAQKCPIPLALVFWSFAPGCVEKLKSPAAKSGPPPGCEIE
jgi:hypothetical protein